MNKHIIQGIKILIRLIVLPFFAGIALVAVSKAFVLYLADFLRYGSEMVTFRKANSQKTLADIYTFLEQKVTADSPKI